MIITKITKVIKKYEIKEINVQQRGEGRRPPFGGNSTRVYSGDYLMKAGLEIRVGRGDLSSNVYEISEIKQEVERIPSFLEKQKVLKVGEIYTADTTFNAPDNRVFIKEWKRFSFSMSRFEVVEQEMNHEFWFKQ